MVLLITNIIIVIIKTIIKNNSNSVRNSRIELLQKIYSTMQRLCFKASELIEYNHQPTLSFILFLLDQSFLLVYPSSSNFKMIRDEDLEEIKELSYNIYETVYHGNLRGTDVATKQIKRAVLQLDYMNKRDWLLWLLL
ncbi:hypothetical protein HanIR_Chr15g0771071 [Helianthus annuus]|nr:hypothetical protein HanIR_Chr15g0771071 [Helianthus annuus]